MQQATTVRMPATDRTQSLEEVLGAWLTRPAVPTRCLSARGQTENKKTHHHLFSHTVYSPMQFGRRRSPGASRVATPESPAGLGLGNGPRPG